MSGPSNNRDGHGAEEQHDPKGDARDYCIVKLMWWDHAGVHVTSS